MKLAFPHALWLLALVPVYLALVLREERRRRERLGQLGDAAVIGRLVVGEDPGRRRRRRGAAILAFACFVLGLAGPRLGDRTELMPRRGLDLVFALDVSRSMLARDVLPDRLERAKAELSFRLDRLGENRMGLVAFAGSAFVQCPLTTDVEALRAFIRVLAPDVVPQGGTALAAGLDVAAGLFEAQAEVEGEEGSAGRVLVLITDGEDHEGGLEQAEQRLKALGVDVVLIGVGSGLGEPIPVLDDSRKVISYVTDKGGDTVMTRMSAETLEAVAARVGGIFIDGTRDPSLGLDQVEARVNRLEKRDLQARVRTTYIDRASWPLGLGLLCLLGALLGPGRPRRRRSALPGGARAPVAAAGLLGLLGALGAGPAAAEGPARLFTRPEPHLEAGVAALERGDFDGAVEAYKKARTENRNERAIVEFNVGAALLAKAQQMEATQGEGAPGAPGGVPDEVKQKTAELYEQAEEAFRRSRDLASSGEVRSDAALGTGFAKARSGDMKGAIGSFRDAVVDNPENGLARHNLRAALQLMAMQPPPPPSSGGDEQDSDESDQGEEQEQQEQQGQGEDDRPQDEQQPDDESQDEQQGAEQDQQKAQGEKGEQGDKGKEDQGKGQNEPADDKQDASKGQDGSPQPRPGEGQDDKPPEPGEQQKPAGPSGEDEKDAKEKGAPPPAAGQQEGSPEKAQPAPMPSPGDEKREDAARILDAMRRREKPLHPFSMRGSQARALPPEKDW